MQNLKSSFRSTTKWKKQKLVTFGSCFPQPRLNIKVYKVAKFTGNAGYLLTVLVHKERLPTDHHRNEESEHKTTRALLAYADILIKHSKWVKCCLSNLQRLHYFIFYYTTPLPYPFHLTWVLHTSKVHFSSSSSPPRLHRETQRTTKMTMKATTTKSKRYLYWTIKNQIFLIYLELNVLLIKAFELSKNTC